jgi:hypothetical protein
MPILAVRADKAVIWPQIYLEIESFGPTSNFPENTPLAGLRNAKRFRTKLTMRAFNLALERTGIVRIIDPGVADIVTIFSQSFREMAHCGEDEGYFLFVVANIGRLRHHLAHEHGIAGFVCAIQRRDGQRQLVSKDEEQPGQENSLWT